MADTLQINPVYHAEGTGTSLLRGGKKRIDRDDSKGIVGKP